MTSLKKQQLVVVLGMHRSGTSAITKSLEALGISLGSELHPAGPDNPRGFWENVECIEINKALLEHLNSDSNGFDLTWSDFRKDAFVSELMLKAFKVVSDNIGRSNGVWGFKDPRTCRLLFFWNEVFSTLDCEVKFVIAVRNPASVAASLEIRNGIVPVRSYFLWVQYVLLSFKHTKGYQRVVVDYDQMLADPYGQIVRIAERLGLSKPNRDDPLIEDYVNNFLENCLRHTSFSFEQLALDSRVSSLVLKTYDLLLRLANDFDLVEDQKIQNEFNVLIDRLGEFSPAFEYVDEVEHKLLHLSKSLEDRDAQVAKFDNLIGECDRHTSALSHALAERDGQISAFNQALAERDGQISAFNQALAERDGQISAFNQALAERDGQIFVLNQALVERDGQISGLNHALIKRDGRIFGLNHALAKHYGQISGLNQALAERDELINFLNEMINELQQSHSWRFTKPLRRIFSGVSALRAAPKCSSVRIPVIQQLEIRRIQLSPLFDKTFYAKKNPDISAARIDPATHYCLSGWKEHRDPSKKFCTAHYLKSHPDVAAAGINPLLHYIKYGEAEGRQISDVENDF